MVCRLDLLRTDGSVCGRCRQVPLLADGDLVGPIGQYTSFVDDTRLCLCRAGCNRPSFAVGIVVYGRCCVVIAHLDALHNTDTG